MAKVIQMKKITFRISQDEKKQLRRLAQKRGFTLKGFMKNLVLQALSPQPSTIISLQLLRSLGPANLKGILRHIATQANIVIPNPDDLDEEELFQALEEVGISEIALGE